MKCTNMKSSVGGVWTCMYFRVAHYSPLSGGVWIREQGDILVLAPKGLWTKRMWVRRLAPEEPRLAVVPLSPMAGGCPSSPSFSIWNL